MYRTRGSIAAERATTRPARCCSLSDYRSSATNQRTTTAAVVHPHRRAATRLARRGHTSAAAAISGARHKTSRVAVRWGSWRDAYPLRASHVGARPRVVDSRTQRSATRVRSRLRSVASPQPAASCQVAADCRSSVALAQTNDERRAPLRALRRSEVGEEPRSEQLDVGVGVATAP